MKGKYWRLIQGQLRSRLKSSAYHRRYLKALSGSFISLNGQLLILPMGSTGVNYPHWMDRTIAMRLIPGAYDPVLSEDFFVKLHLPSQFDALVFVQKSTPAELTR